MLHDLDNALVFARVVEEGSFTAASRRLAIPTTTASRRVKALERRLGARLLNRTTRRLSLTEAGEVYYAYCRRIAAQLQEAESAVRGLEQAPRGWLRVSAPSAVCPELLASLAGGFRERCPEVRLDILRGSEGIDPVANRIDVALRTGPLPDSSLVARPLARYRCGVFASAAYLARYGEPADPGELVHHRTLVEATSRKGERFVWRLHDGERHVDAAVEPVTIANDPAVLRDLLAAGRGLMLTCELVAGAAIRGGGVHRVLPAWTGPDVELLAVFPGGRLVSPKVRTFVDFVAAGLAPGRRAAPGDVVTD